MKTRFTIESEELSEIFEKVKTLEQCGEMQLALRKIRTEIFRPFRKSGHSDPVANALYAECGTSGEQLIDILEAQFSEIVGNLGLDV